MLINQNKAFFIILTNPNKVLCMCIRIKQLGARDRPNIFSNIQLINKHFHRDIDWHMKEQSWKNKACDFINFQVIIKKLPWRAIRDRISATKGL